jgi:diguanylate cyclase (GGDEF)-like protein
LKILVAEDDPIARCLVEQALTGDGYQPVYAEDGESAWDLLRKEDCPKMAILDWMMPRMDGLEVCRRLRELKNRPYVYVVLLTSMNQIDDIVAGLEAGADDYLTKPFQPRELLARLRTGRRILDLQEQLTAARRTVEYEATHDHLTGVWSRSAIIEFLKRELSRGRREGKPVGVAMADIDHFKQVNDAFGHLVGDAVLREAAERFRSALRVYDTIGRYGGEEFMVVMPGCDLPSAQKVSERLRQALCETRLTTFEGGLRLTISIGVTSTEDLRHIDVEPVIKTADDALYEAKRAGRNCVIARPHLSA